MSIPMEATLRIGGNRYRVAAGDGIDISIPLEFGGPQPSHFGAPPARATPLESGGFVGDMRRGGSCNCRTLTLVPHCNGTHTECLGHITDEPSSVAALATRPLYAARLVTVEPEPAASSAESTSPEPEPGDTLITRAALSAAGLGSGPAEALVVRTLPNPAAKRIRDWGRGSIPAYFTTEAMTEIVAAGIEHLLVDVPSIDRTHDGGRLTTHRIFWGMTADDQRAAARPRATVTEMIFVPAEVPDGLYALALHLPPFVTDAAPSRPLLYPLEAL